MAIVQNMSPLSVRSGGVVRLAGSGFDSACAVTVGGNPVRIQDYGDNYLEFEAPKDTGTSAVKLLRSNAEQFSASLTVVGLEDAETWNIPERGEDEFRNAQLGLMPRGFAWHTGKTGNWWKLFSAFASGFKAIYDSLRSLVDALSPVKTTDYSVWERELGLPLKGLEQSSNAGRKNEIMRVSRGRGGATVPYLKSLLDLYGARYDVYEYWKDPSKFPTCVAAREGDYANFCVRIKVYQDSYNPKGFKCTSKCNGSLGFPRDTVLESIIDQEKPAHIKIIYSYVVRVLTDMNGNPIVNDNNQMIIV